MAAEKQHDYSKSGALALFESTPEITTPVELTVTGQIPSWISGILFRTGPGGYEVPLNKGVKYRGGDAYKVDHWFDGIGQAHSFNIKDGKVIYRSKNLADSYVREIASKGDEITGTSFAQMEVSTLKKIKGLLGTGGSPQQANEASGRNISVTISPDFPVPDGAESSSNTVPHTLVTKTDANALQQLDPETLEPSRIFNYKDLTKGVAGNGPLSGAHHQFDPETNEYFNYTVALGSTVKHEVFSVPGLNSKAEARLLAYSESWTATYLHAFYMTKNYLVLPFYPYHITARGLTILWHGNVNSGLKFYPNKPTLFRVIDRHGKGHIATYRAPASFAFHTINAQEVNDDLWLDVVATDSANIVSELNVDKLKKGGPVDLSTPRRYILKNVSKQETPGNDESASAKLPNAEVQLLGSAQFDLPRWNPTFKNKQIRFVYGISRTPELSRYLRNNSDNFGTPFINALSKSDFVSKTHVLWNKDMCYPGEPVFVSRPGGVDEDDGVVLSVVYDATKKSSCLLVLDARSFEEIACATFEGTKVGEHMICLGFHGSFYPL